MTPPPADRGILAIGAPFVDTVVHIEESFLTDHGLSKGGVTIVSLENLQTLLQELGGPQYRFPGGSGANVIRGLAALGWHCSLTGKIGDDEAGHWLLDTMATLSITTHYLIGKAGTGQVLCLVTPDGERTMVDYLGASSEMRSEELAAELFYGRKLLHIEGYSLLQENLAPRAMALAHSSAVPISFDLANVNIVKAHKTTIEELLSRYVTIVFANSMEATALSGLEPKDACRWLASRCHCAVVTMGAHGCFVASRETSLHHPSYPVAHVVDSTGAGDLFASGFLDGWLRGYPLSLAAAQGSLLAAAVITREGSLLDEPSWERVRQLLRTLSS